MHTTKRYFTIIIILSSCLSTFVVQSDTIQLDSVTIQSKVLKEAQQQIRKSPKKSYQVFKESFSFFTTRGDTLQVIRSLMGMAEVEKQSQKYSLAFEHLSEAMFLANRKGIPYFQIRINRELATLYDVYEMDRQSIEHIQIALDLSKHLFEKDSTVNLQLTENYLSLAIRQRRIGNYEKALLYLDSCVFLDRHDTTLNYNYTFRPFVEAEKGFNLLKLGHFENAKVFLYRSKSFCESNDLNYAANIYLRLGDLKVMELDADSAIIYYSKCNIIMDSLNYNRVRQPDVLEKLANLYYARKNYALAHQLLTASKDLEAEIQKAKTQSVKNVFEVKNKYRRLVVEKEAVIEQQDTIIYQNTQTQLRLRFLLVTVIMLSLGFFVFIRMRQKLRRLTFEKKATEMEAQHNKEKAEAILEVKSKELTASTLRMIEMETAQNSLLQALKKSAPQEYTILKRNIEKGKIDLWKEFELRFTDVSNDFYERLNKKHPALTPTEQKHCALLKLNFDGHEMAQLLNISLNSVHVSRYRIRKKMGLKRSENLRKYIAEI